MITILFDLDGTLIDSERRFKLGQKGNKIDWNFVLNPSIVQTLDKPMPKEIIDKIVEICQELKCEKIIIVTGRPENLREVTLRQLQDVNIKFDELIMRKPGDYRKEVDYKISILYELAKRYEITAVFDDNEEVLKCVKSIFPNVKAFKVSKEGVNEFIQRTFITLDFYLK